MQIKMLLIAIATIGITLNTAFADDCLGLEGRGLKVVPKKAPVVIKEEPKVVIKEEPEIVYKEEPKVVVKKACSLRVALLDLAKLNDTLKVTLNKAHYIDGDALLIDVVIPHEGYLNIINVGYEDNTTVLYPNQYHPDNYVSPGHLSLPTIKMGFDLIAGAPYGPSLVVVFLTKTPINLYQNGHSIIVDGSAIEVFRSLSDTGAAAFRSFVVSARKGNAKFDAGYVETQVCPKTGHC